MGPLQRVVIRRYALGLAMLLACAPMALGYPVGPPLSLEKLTEEADIIFKGTAISGAPVADDWFKPYDGFVSRETRFKVVSVIKGERPGDKLGFRHYAEDPQPAGRMFQPQHYHFEAARSYIVFAKKTETAGVFRQLWINHKGKEDQGVLLCPDDKALGPATVHKAMWTELTAMLTSPKVSDVTYAVGQLDQMSCGAEGFSGLLDFDRKDVLMTVRVLMANREPKIAQAAITLVGSHNPYMTDERTVFWLATVGSAELPGLSKMDPKRKNMGGERDRKDLVAVADSKAPNETRAMAILALGLVREPSLKQPIERWLADPVPEVKACAAVLLADFPGPETCGRLRTLAGAANPEVRVSVARAIGFGQMTQMAGVLAELLLDQEFKVRQQAVMSLLSFAPKDEAIRRILQANLRNEEFSPLFLIALAREHPADYLDALAKAVNEKTEPKAFWGGRDTGVHRMGDPL